MKSADRQKPSVILVEDNETLREELTLYLSDEGFTVRGVDCGSDLNEALAAQHTDILILDLNLPEEEGLSITRRIRSSMPSLGIIILTARVRSIDRLEGYAAGADVFLTKPTRPEELTAVINNLFGRLQPEADTGKWQLDIAGLLLLSPAGIPINLTEGEALLLRELAFFGRCVEHDVLISRLGDESQPEKVNKARIEVLVCRLRRKLEPYVDAGSNIKALRGRGYQLNFPLIVKKPRSIFEAE